MRKKHLFGTSCNIGNGKKREVGIYESPFTTCGVTQALENQKKKNRGNVNVQEKKSNVTA